MASIDSGLGDSHAAAHAIENALHVTPGDEELQLIAAVAEAEAGEWTACIRNIEPLYKKHPNPRNGLVLLRAELASHADFAPTLESLRTLKLPADQELELRVHAAELLASADRHLEAIDRTATGVENCGAETTKLCSTTLPSSNTAPGNLIKSLATLTSLRAQHDSAEIEDLIGDIEEQRGDRSTAVHSHESAIAMAPQEERFRLSLGAELLKYQQYQAAVVGLPSGCGIVSRFGPHLRRPGDGLLLHGKIRRQRGCLLAGR